MRQVLLACACIGMLSSCDKGDAKGAEKSPRSVATASAKSPISAVPRVYRFNPVFKFDRSQATTASKPGTEYCCSPDALLTKVENSVKEPCRAVDVGAKDGVRGRVVSIECELPAVKGCELRALTQIWALRATRGYGAHAYSWASRSCGGVPHEALDQGEAALQRAAKNSPLNEIFDRCRDPKEVQCEN